MVVSGTSSVFSEDTQASQYIVLKNAMSSCFANEEQRY